MIACREAKGWSWASDGSFFAWCTWKGVYTSLPVEAPRTTYIHFYIVLRRHCALLAGSEPSQGSLS